MLLQQDRAVYLSAMGELEPGAVFAGHRIESVAGRGGMGVVYRATQLALDRTVALKVIAPGLLEDQTVRARFVRESKVAASIDHPNVIPVYYAGEENGVAYIAMRYVHGDDVRSLVRREGHLPPERAAHIAAQIASALDAAHAAGLVHRDIKPANVLLTQEDHVYLTDFGLTKHALSVAGSTKPGHWVGTLDYVAPEQIRAERIDARADVYALGCLLYFALTGEVPFKRDSDEARLWAHLSDPPPKPSERVPGVPEAFDIVIERALAKDPEERYPSAGDLGRAARAAAAGRAPSERERLVATGAAAPIESPTVTAAPRPPQQRHAAEEAETVVRERSRFQRTRRPALYALALLGAAAGGVIAAVALGVGESDPPRAQPTPQATATASPTPAPGMTIARDVIVGQRPNVLAAADGKIFVGSFRLDRMSIVSAESGQLLAERPKVGRGASGAAVGFGSVWVSASRARQVVRLDPRTGRLKGAPIKFTGAPSAIAIAKNAVWVGVIYADAPDLLVKLDPKTGEQLGSVEYPNGIMALAASPSAVWVVARRRTLVHRANPRTGEIIRSKQVSRGRGADIEYRDGAIWVPAPDDDTVYKMLTKTGEVIPISVGQRPRQVALGEGGRVYVTSYNSSQVHAIDERRGAVVEEPLSVPTNPFALVANGGSVWVASQPDNVLSEILTGRGG